MRRHRLVRRGVTDKRQAREAVAQAPSPTANRVISADIASSVADAFVTGPMRRSYLAMLRHS